MDFNTAVPFSPSLSTPTAAPKIPSDGDLLKGLTMSPPLSTAQPSSITNNILKPSAFAPMSLPSVSQTPLMNVLSLEAKEVAIREQQLTSRQSEVATLTQQLLDLKPSADDLKKKREQIDSDYKKANEQRSQLSIELIQLRAEYELDLETLKDRQEMLARDIHALQVASTELQQYKDAIALIKKENQSLQEKIDMQKSQVGDMQAQVSRYAEETAKLREANQKVFEESKSQQQQFDVLEKMVESGKDEYRIVKENLDLEGNRLEQEKKKFQALEQQVSVQAAINEREKLKMKEIEKERKEMEIKAKELMVTEARLKDALALQEKELDAATSAREHQEAAVKAAEARELLANAVPHSEVIIPASEPPPPLPSLSKKPTQSSKENIAEAMVKERSSPVLPEIGNQKTKNQQDSIELDNLLSGNKPKSNSHDEKRATASPQPDFESFFATPNQSSFPQESPKKTSAEDMKRAMEMAFANTTLKAAKDTPSLAGSSSTLKKAAFSTDQFTFDSSFSAPQPLKSGNTISIKKSTNFGNFDDAKFTGFKPPTKTSPQDLDSVFGGASIPAPTGFDNDPFAGPNGFVSANATTASSNFGNDPFGAADFGNTPFPAPSQITSSPKGNDTPEVKSITSMGFTREQAVNALEM